LDKNLARSLFASAGQQALEHFPLEADRIELVAYSENVTFRVWDRNSDASYVLRLHRPGYNSLEELESERAWVMALSNAGLSVPEPLLTHQGKHFDLIEIHGTGEHRHVGVTTWLEGSILSEYLEGCPDRTERYRMFHRMGEILATIHNQSTQWDIPPGFRRRRLDVEGLLGEEPHWGRFWEHEDLSETEQQILVQARFDAHARLTEYGEIPKNFSLIHSDLHPENLVHNEGDLALIDFDDTAFGWHMYDVAAVLIELHADPDFELLCTAVLEGYRAHRKLASRDVQMLPDFLLIRGMAIIGWFHQRPEHAGSSYFEEIKNWVLVTCNLNESRKS